MKVRVAYAAVAAFFLIAGTSTSEVQASDLVYQPVSPTFGGNPLNGNFLLNQAQIQNQFVDSGGGGGGGGAPAINFPPIDIDLGNSGGAGAPIIVVPLPNTGGNN